MAGLGSLGPLGKIAVVGTTVGQVIGNNSNRNGLIFFNSSTTQTVYLAPSNTPGFTATGQGITLLPQGDTGNTLMPAILPIGYGAAWSAIATGANVSILILEFFGA